jgi:hypothetical protein
VLLLTRWFCSDITFQASGGIGAATMPITSSTLARIDITRSSRTPTAQMP